MSQMDKWSRCRLGNCERVCQASCVESLDGNSVV